MKKFTALLILALSVSSPLNNAESLTPSPEYSSNRPQSAPSNPQQTKPPLEHANSPANRTA